MNHDHDYETIQYNNSELPFAYAVNKIVLPDDHKLRVPKWHEQLEFKLILSGSAEFICGTNVFIAQKGDIVAVNSCEPHAMRPDGENKVEYHILMVSPNMLYTGRMEQIILSIFSGQVRFRNHIRDSVVCRNLLSAFFDELSAQKDAYELSSIGYLSLFLAELLRSQATDLAPHTQYDDILRYTKKLEPAFLMISEYYHTELSLEDLAASCGKSVYFFCRLFKQVPGKTVISYINEYRLNKAELLLCSTDIPINDISTAVGFSDNSYFSRCFKKKTGITPSACRLEYRQSGHQESPEK